ncbi:MAG: hypothetical protein ACK2T6_09835, partial [Anaerolineae bacterium]
GLLFVAVASPSAEAAGSAPALEQTTPTVAYNSDADLYFVMWVEDRGDGPDIYSKRLFSNALPQGGPSRGGTAMVRSSRTSGPVRRQDPALVYNSDIEEFYLVWSEETDPDDGQDVYGVRVSAAGYARSNPRKLVGGPGDQSHPAIAYHSTNDTYLLVWDDNARDIDEVWGLRVRANGIPNGSPFPMVQGASNAQDPTVARNGDGFLVAWVDDRNGNTDIFGRRVNSNGLPIGGTAGREYSMAGSLEEAFAPSLDPASGTLVYNVYDPLTGLDIVGMEVYPSGTTRAARRNGIVVPAADQASPSTARNPSRSETVVVYADNRSGEFDLYGIRVRNSRPSGRDFPILRDGYLP